MKIIVDTKEKIAEMAAKRCADTIRRDKTAVFGLDFARDLDIVYAAMAQDGKSCYKSATAFVTGEFSKGGGVARHMEESLSRGELFSHSRVFYPKTEEPGKFDEDIVMAGGMELLVCGLGLNGRLGFNEPATEFDTLTHVQKITDASKRELEKYLDMDDTAVTMGIKTLLGAKSVLLFAAGAEKAKIVHDVVYGKTITYIPASMLQLHRDLTLYLDTAAASGLD